MSNIKIDAGAVRKETGEWQAVLVAESDWEENRALAFARRLSNWANIEVNEVEPIIDAEQIKHTLVNNMIKTIEELGIPNAEKIWEIILHAIDMSEWMIVPQFHVDEIRIKD